MTPIKLPELGEGISGGDVLNILVKEGETITADQIILEIETDKAVVEVPASAGGRISKIHVAKGAKALVGDLLLELDSAAAAASAPIAPTTPSSNSSAAATSATVEIKLPELGEGIAGGDVLNILVKEGDTIALEQTILEIETDKAVVDVPSQSAGVVKSVTAEKGKKLKVGDLILTLATSGAASPAPVAAPAPSAPAKAAAPATAPAKVAPASAPVLVPSKNVAAGPATRKLARELGLDLGLVTGSARGGRIVVDDVKAFVRQRMSAPAASAGGVPAPTLPDFAQWGPVEHQPLSALRKKVSEQMTWAWSAPMVTQFDQVDITELEAFRKKFAPEVKEKGGALTVTVFALKAVVEALKEFPQFNCSLDLAKNVIVRKNYFHIGVAVDTPAGLVVPVIRDVDKKSIFDLSVELAGIAKRARDRKVSMDEMRGGCFTISNLGGIGGTSFTPIINPPEVAILGISRGAVQPVWNGKSFDPRTLMPVSVTYDHRVIDGADGARFTRRIVKGLEEFNGKILEA